MRSCRPLAAGWATANSRTLLARVTDGDLELEFEPIYDLPEVKGVELAPFMPLVLGHKLPTTNDVIEELHKRLQGLGESDDQVEVLAQMYVSAAAVLASDGDTSRALYAYDQAESLLLRLAREQPDADLHNEQLEALRDAIALLSYPTTWTVSYYDWSDLPDLGPENWDKLAASPPRHIEQTPYLDFDSSWRESEFSTRSVPEDKAAIVASAEYNLPQGRYELRCVSDDGIRVWINGDLIVDDWSSHSSIRYTEQLELETGVHRVRVSYFDERMDSVLFVGIRAVDANP